MADLHTQIDAQIRPGPEGTPSTPVNRDFAPVAYYFDMALWSSQFNPGYRRLFRAMAGVDFGAMAAAFGVVLAALVAAGRFLTERRRRRPLAAGFCTAATGFSSIGLEMLLLLAFQAVYGYVYQQLAVVIAAFMAGMALGSWLGMVGQASACHPLAAASSSGFSASHPACGGMRVLAITQMLAAAAPLVLLGLFEAMGPAGISNLVASWIAFPALALACGMLGGYEFLIASRIFFAGGAHRPGTLYAFDLAGSCLGAILFSAWLVPVFGFLRTALLSAMVSLAAVAMAMLARSETDPADRTPPACARRTPGR
jgi:spermidine synthase